MDSDKEAVWNAGLDFGSRLKEAAEEIAIQNGSGMIEKEHVEIAAERVALNMAKGVLEKRLELLARQPLFGRMTRARRILTAIQVLELEAQK